MTKTILILTIITPHYLSANDSILNTTLSVYNQCFPGDTMYGSYPGARSRVIEGNNAINGNFFSRMFLTSLKGDKVFSQKGEITTKELIQKIESAIESNSVNYDRLLFVGAITNLIEEESISDINDEPLDEKRIFDKLMYDNVLCNDIDINTQSLAEILQESKAKAKKIKKNSVNKSDLVYELHLNAINADFKILNWSTKNILIRDKKQKF
ncbi:hypothetical protein N9A28_00290 [Sulfurimonas sp.]|nr:hypothetical protein [Sulfurimonas sp.]